HIKRGWQLFRSLFERGIIEILPKTTDGASLRVNVELPENFSMDQTLSLYLLETIPSLDAAAPDYALNLITLVESILEDPDIVLRKQLDKLKAQKMAEMKMQGVEYQERIDELEKLEHPKPNREFDYSPGRFQPHRRMGTDARSELRAARRAKGSASTRRGRG